MVPDNYIKLAINKIFYQHTNPYCSDLTLEGIHKGCSLTCDQGPKLQPASLSATHHTPPATTHTRDAIVGVDRAKIITCSTQKSLIYNALIVM